MNAPTRPAVMQTSELPLDMIVPANTHIQLMRRERFSAPLLKDLAKSISEIGVLQAIVVRPDPGSTGQRFELVAGERRWLAARIAGLTTIPATVRDLTDEQVLKAQLVENLQREGLHELEEAEGYDELMKLEKITAEQVAEMVGKSRSYVFARLKLLALGPEARKAFYTGEIDASRALYVARIANPKLQAKALTLATEKGWKGELQYSVRSLREKLTGSGFSVALNTAPFARGDTTFVQFVRVKKGVDEPRALPDCVSCPNRTGNSLDLFSQDDDPDVCMDPDCYDIKIKQHGERLRKEVEAAGIKVITGDEAKKIAPGKNELAGYVDLDLECEEDEYVEREPEPEYPDNDDDAAAMAAYEKAMSVWEAKADAYKSRTFRQLLAGTPVNAIVIEDPRDHRIRTLVPYKEAEKALKKQHKIELNDWNYGGRPQRQPASESAADREEYKRKQEEAHAREQAEMAFRRAVMTAVFAKWSGPLKREDLQAIAECIIADNYQMGESLTLVYGKGVQPWQMKEADLVRLLVTCTVIRSARWANQSPKALLELAHRLKIDPDKIKKELKAAAKEQPEKKSTKKPAAKKAKKT